MREKERWKEMVKTRLIVIPYNPVGNYHHCFSETSEEVQKRLSRMSHLSQTNAKDRGEDYQTHDVRSLLKL